MLLSIQIFLPLLVASILVLVPIRKWVRTVALLGDLVNLGVSIHLLLNFDGSSAALQFVEKVPWINKFGINYFLGVDGLSIWLLVLTNFIMPITIIAAWNFAKDKVIGFHVSLLAMQSFMLGSFLAIDLVLFYCFWELSLIPMYFLIGIWGGPKRVYATVKFFIFTMMGSVFMLLAVISLIYLTKAQLGEFSASIIDIYQLDITYIKNEWMSPQTLLFMAFMLAFAIKVPLFPVHTWLPDAHTEAPTAGSVLLAGVMLKMGTYAILRFVLPTFPEVVQDWSWLFLFLGVVGIVYGSLVALNQTDIKRLVAYSSVAHMGYVIIGIFALNIYGLTGSLYQMLNHGISTGALFILVGMIYDRTHTRKIADYGGLASKLPLFSTAFFLVLLSSIAVPGTNGFIGEFLILMGTFYSHKAFGIVALFGVILGAAYMLWMFKKVFFGQSGKVINKEDELADLNLREIGLASVLVVVIFWMGIFPNHFLEISKPSLEHLDQNRVNYSLELYDAQKSEKEMNN